MLVDSITLSAFLILLVVGGLQWQKHNNRVALISIMMIGLILRIYVSSDPYLHAYDERYHALVSKNLLDDWLRPVLYSNPILPYDFRDWWSNHIWLSKPILPFYLMASSMKLFGSTLLAIRLPSVILGTLSVYLTFKIAQKLFSTRIALLATFFHAIQGTMLELAGGRISSDHVDTCFLFFTQLFFYLCVVSQRNTRYFLAGMSLGLAFLSKWIAALIPLLVIFIFSLMTQLKLRTVDWLKILIPCLLLGGVWVLYILNAFPQEALHTFDSLLGVINDSDTTHSNGPLYYLDRVRIIFGELIYLPMLLIVYDAVTRKNDNSLNMICIWIFVPLILFTLATGKRYTYLMIAAPAFFIMTAYYFQYFYETAASKSIPGARYLFKIIALLLLLLPLRFSLERLKFFQPHENERITSATLKKINISKDYNASNSIVIRDQYPIELTFYTGLSTYDYIPDQLVLDSLKEKGFNILIRTNLTLTEYKQGVR